MSTVSPAELATELAAATPVLNDQDQLITLTLYRLLADGEPVDRQDLADRAGLSRDQVDAALQRAPALSYDDKNRVISFHGLSIHPTCHRLIVNSRTLYTWCAWDTLFLPELLGRPAEVRSQCPTTGEPITLTVSGTDMNDIAPEATVVSFLHRAKPLDADTITTFCHYIHFFASPAAAHDWTAQHDGTFTISLADAMEIARLTNRARYPSLLTD